MDGLANIEGEDLETRIKIAAHHEAGHAAIAAQLELRLRAEGIMVGQDAEGLACYCKQPDATDASVRAHILASFAGIYAENRFRRLQNCRERDYETLTWSLDWREARRIEGTLSSHYLGGRNIQQAHRALEEQAEGLVAANWASIARLAEVLLGKAWEPKKPLKSGDKWSEAAMAKYLSGEEIVEILRGFDIRGTCVEDC